MKNLSVGFTLLTTLLYIQTSVVETLPAQEKNLEEKIPYPSVDDDTDCVSYEDTSELGSRSDSPKNKSTHESPPAWQGKIGNAEVTVDVKNTDFLSQCKAEQEKRLKKDAPKKKRSTRGKNKNNETDDHSPELKILVKWGKD